MDCAGQDNDKYIYPGASEVFDVRDNDCDGQHDEDGLIKLDRYFKPWTGSDWEHRFSSSSLAGWELDGHWIKLYPSNICSSAQKPKDGCTALSGGKTIELWGGFLLVALSQCTGMLGSYHISLVLSELSGEYGDYSVKAGFTCTRLGYIPGASVGATIPHAVQFYRHRSPFNASGKGDNMWSSDPTEGSTWYDQHESDWKVVFGY